MGYGQPAVHAPESGKAGRIEPLAPLGRGAQRLSRLANIVLKEPGFGERTPDLDLLVAMQPRALQGTDQEGRRLGSGPALQRLHGLPVKVVLWHAREYSRYTVEVRF